MNTTDPHWERKQFILKKFPEVRSLYGSDLRTLWYIGAVVVIQLGLAYLASLSSMAAAIVMGITIGPCLDMGVLVIMHELSHNRCTGKKTPDRLLSILANTLMLAPISEIFRQHHNMHHYHLGNDMNDVDVPMPVEVKFVGNSSILKFFWLFFNMVILPIRSLYKVEVKTNKWLIINWVACLGFSAAVFFWSTHAFTFLALSLFFSQGLHPANSRQLQRHLWDGSAEKEVNTVGGGPQTFSYYGWINAITLNVGYHNEHHDFAEIPWTNLPILRRIVGDEYYPDSTAYEQRGWGVIWNFVMNPNVTLGNFYNAAENEKKRVACGSQEPSEEKAVPPTSGSSSSSKSGSGGAYARPVRRAASSNKL